MRRWLVCLTILISTFASGVTSWTNGTTGLPGATIGVAYNSGALTVTCASAPCTFSVVSGGAGFTAAGFVINASTGAITASSPSAKGSTIFTVRVTDNAAAHADQQFFIPTNVALDAYKVPVNVVPGCTPSGSTYFQTYKISGVWWLADPACNYFSFLGVDSVQYVFLNNYAGKYGSNLTNWELEQRKRLTTWAFNSAGQYFTNPVFGYDAANNIPTMASLVNIEPSSGTSSTLTHWDTTGGNVGCGVGGRSYTQPINDILAGVPSAYGLGDPTSVQDVYDQEYQDCTTNTVANAHSGGGAGFPNFNTNQFVVAIVLGDMDFRRMERGGGTTNFPHIGFLITVTNPLGSTGAQVPSGHQNVPGGTGALGIIRSKGAMFCGGWTSNASVCNGTSLLEKKYQTSGAPDIKKLNASWGTTALGTCNDGAGGYYTTFGSDPAHGAYGGGCGLMDTDGQHGNQSSWLGSDPAYNSDNGNCGTAGEPKCNVATDLDLILYTYVYKDASTEINTIRLYDTNHLIVGPNFFGNTSSIHSLRPQPINAYLDAGVGALFVLFDGYAPNAGQSTTYFMNYVHNQSVAYGKDVPQLIWKTECANADSYYTGMTAENICFNYATQSARGAAYATDLSTIFATGYALGQNHWALTDDNSAEHTNVGLVTLNDNAYDATMSIVATGIDQFLCGASCPMGLGAGGEAGNYGTSGSSYIAQVANANILQQQFPLPSGIGGMVGSGAMTGTGKQKGN